MNNNLCFPCTGDNCISCYNSSTCTGCNYPLVLTPDLKCSSVCPAGYYSSNQVCYKCSPDCLTCTNGSSCTGCPTGLTLTNGECKVPNPNCLYTNTNNCNQCDANCYNCTSTKSCSQCSPPYYLISSLTCVQTCP